MFIEAITYILAGLLFLFAVMGLGFILEASGRKDENRDEETYK